MSPPSCTYTSTRRAPSVRPLSGPKKSETPQVRLAPSASAIDLIARRYLAVVGCWLPKGVPESGLDGRTGRAGTASMRRRRVGALLVGYRSRCGDRVELIRVIEHRRFGGARSPCVVMAGDRMQQLRARVRL